MPYRRRPKESKFSPKREEFIFKTGTKEHPEPKIQAKLIHKTKKKPPE